MQKSSTPARMIAGNGSGTLSNREPSHPPKDSGVFTSLRKLSVHQGTSETTVSVTADHSCDSVYFDPTSRPAYLFNLRSVGSQYDSSNYFNTTNQPTHLVFQSYCCTTDVALSLLYFRFDGPSTDLGIIIPIYIYLNQSTILDDQDADIIPTYHVVWHVHLGVERKL